MPSNNPRMTICCFLDSDRSHPPDSTGLNKVGYITSDECVIFPFRKQFKSVPLQRFRAETLELCQMAISAERMHQIDLFFRSNVLNPVLIRRAFNTITRGELDFFDDPIKLPRLDPITSSEHRDRWERAMALVQFGDLLQIFDESSVVSRLIAKVDRGCWSHSASYGGEGKVFESITSGVTIRPLEVYNKSSIRLGIYRMEGMTPENAKASLSWAQSQVGKPYGWNQLFRAGIEKIFFYSPTRKPIIPTPNDLIVWTDSIKLIALV
jgi:hypothetical protein